jgi:hypothetical protein
MNIRFYIDPATGEAHIRRHGVTEEEVSEAVRNKGEEHRGRENSRILIGQTDAGRYLRIIFVPERMRRSIFVITAYELSGQPLIAYRRRRWRKGKPG